MLANSSCTFLSSRASVLVGFFLLHLRADFTSARFSLKANVYHGTLCLVNIYIFKTYTIYIYIYIYIYSHPQEDYFVVSHLYSVARHVWCLKQESKPAQLYLRLSIIPLSQQANHVRSGIIRHYVVAFMCLHFCLTRYESANFIWRALYYSSGSRQFLRQSVQPPWGSAYCHPQTDCWLYHNSSVIYHSYLKNMYYWIYQKWKIALQNVTWLILRCILLEFDCFHLKNQ